MHDRSVSILAVATHWLGLPEVRGGLCTLRSIVLDVPAQDNHPRHQHWAGVHLGAQHMTPKQKAAKKPLTQSEFQRKLYEAFKESRLAAYGDPGEMFYAIYRATLYATVEGRQRKNSAGWPEKQRRVQWAVLRSLARRGAKQADGSFMVRRQAKRVSR